MKERDLDEFESLFRRAVIPTIEVDAIEVRDIVVLADFSERAEACGAIAAELKERFGARVSARFLLHPRDHDHEGEARALMERVAADERRVVEGDPAAALKRIVDEEKPSMILAPAPLHLHDPSPEADALGEFLDRLLVATAIPTLLVRRPARESVFRRILAKIPGGRHELIEQFSFAFALCPPGGLVRLLHVVEKERLDELAEVLRVAPGIDTEEGAAGLLDAIETRMNQLLRGAVRTAKDAGFTVEADVDVGDPFELVPRQAKDFSLLIVGSPSSHREFLESRAYRLIQAVPDIPVLAL